MPRVLAARVGVGFALAFVVVLAALHVLEPEYNADGHLISEYELGRYGWLMSLAFFSLAGASLSLWVAIRDGLQTTTGRIGTWWLPLVALAYLGAGLFYPDESTGLGLPADPAEVNRGAVAPTLNATLHGLSGVIVIASTPVVFTLLYRGLARNPHGAAQMRGLRWLTWLTWVGLVSFPISLAIYSAVQRPGSVDVRVMVSVANRFIILTYAAWLAAAACQSARVTPPKETDAHRPTA